MLKGDENQIYSSTDLLNQNPAKVKGWFGSKMSTTWANGSLLSFLASSNPYSANARIVGKVLQSNPAAGQSIIEACDNKNVVVHSQVRYKSTIVNL